MYVLRHTCFLWKVSQVKSEIDTFKSLKTAQTPLQTLIKSPEYMNMQMFYSHCCTPQCKVHSQHWMLVLAEY